MNEYNTEKKYESFKIPDRHQDQEDGASWSSPIDKKDTPFSQDGGLFYVIDYDASDMKGVGKFVLKSQKIEPPAKDDIRELFHSMRDIARANNYLYYGGSKIFDKRVQQENAKVFYKQGIFMKDFTDSYDESTPFSSYFPNYQMMSYEQLRTYFTWRTKVREGNVTDTSLSYAFLYIYELLNNIGVANPQDGLNRLIFFRKAFSVYNKAIDKYFLRWLKDYHIYYELPKSFREFVEENNLAQHYPKLADTDNSFDLFCSISKYDIRSSAFFAGDMIKLITDCFYFVINKLRLDFEANGIHFDEAVFQPTKKMLPWQPFGGALFYEWLKQPDRRVVLSENEIYICSRNNWTSGTVLTSEDGRLLLGYIMKQMEAVLRAATKYKYKLSANIGSVSHTLTAELNKMGLSLDKIISASVMEFYREATKTVVSVDHKALSRIRKESLITQEKLIVPEQNEQSLALVPELISEPDAIPDLIPGAATSGTGSDLIPDMIPGDRPDSIPGVIPGATSGTGSDLIPDLIPGDRPDSIPGIIPDVMSGTVPGIRSDVIPGVIPGATSGVSSDVMPGATSGVSSDVMPEIISDLISDAMPDLAPDSWEGLRNALSAAELQALSILMSGEADIKKFADSNNVMLEVLIDGINEKAMDFVGDNLLDDEFTIYEEYKDQVKEMVG